MLRTARACTAHWAALGTCAAGAIGPVAAASGSASAAAAGAAPSSAWAAHWLLLPHRRQHLYTTHAPNADGDEAAAAADQRQQEQQQGPGAAWQEDNPSQRQLLLQAAVRHAVQQQRGWAGGAAVAAAAAELGLSPAAAAALLGAPTAMGAGVGDAALAAAFFADCNSRLEAQLATEQQDLVQLEVRCVHLPFLLCRFVLPSAPAACPAGALTSQHAWLCLPRLLQGAPAAGPAAAAVHAGAGHRQLAAGAQPSSPGESNSTSH